MIRIKIDASNDEGFTGVRIDFPSSCEFINLSHKEAQDLVDQLARAGFEPSAEPSEMPAGCSALDDYLEPAEFDQTQSGFKVREAAAKIQAEHPLRLEKAAEKRVGKP